MTSQRKTVMLILVLALLSIYVGFELSILIFPFGFIHSNVRLFWHVSLLFGLNESGIIRFLTNHSAKKGANILNHVVMVNPVCEVWMGKLGNSTFGALVERTSQNPPYFFGEGTSGRPGWEIAADVAGICPPPMSIWQEIFLKAVSAPAPSRLMNIGRLGGLFQDKCCEMKKRLQRLLGVAIGRREAPAIAIPARRYDFLEKMASLSVVITAYFSRFLVTPAVVLLSCALVGCVTIRTEINMYECVNEYQWHREHQLPWAIAWFALRIIGLVIHWEGAGVVCWLPFALWILRDGDDSVENLWLAEGSMRCLAMAVMLWVMSVPMSVFGSMLEDWTFRRWAEDTAAGQGWAAEEEDTFEGDPEPPFSARVRGMLTRWLGSLSIQRRSETDLVLSWGGRLPLRRVETSGEMCDICWGVYENGELIAQFPCGHEFHEMCTEDWAISHPCCPKCRAGLRA
jgi:hypothetical protein